MGNERFGRRNGESSQPLGMIAGKQLIRSSGGKIARQQCQQSLKGQIGFPQPRRRIGIVNRDDEGRMRRDGLAAKMIDEKCFADSGVTGEKDNLRGPGERVQQMSIQALNLVLPAGGNHWPEANAAERRFNRVQRTGQLLTFVRGGAKKCVKYRSAPLNAKRSRKDHDSRDTRSNMLARFSRRFEIRNRLFGEKSVLLVRALTNDRGNPMGEGRL
jgi:hypothetical protein